MKVTELLHSLCLLHSNDPSKWGRLILFNAHQHSQSVSFFRPSGHSLHPVSQYPREVRSVIGCMQRVWLLHPFLYTYSGIAGSRVIEDEFKLSERIQKKCMQTMCVYVVCGPLPAPTLPLSLPPALPTHPPALPPSLSPTLPPSLSLPLPPPLSQWFETKGRKMQ